MRLSGLFIYPVKGMRGVALPEAAVESCGLGSDRRWMVVDAQGGFLSQRQVPALARFSAAVEPCGLRLDLDGSCIRVERPAPDGKRVSVVVWRSRVHAACAGSRANSWLSSRLQRRCRLVFLDDPQARPIEPAYAEPGETVSFADGFPVLLASEASLARLNAAVEQPVGMDRFRPNLVIEGADAWAEDDWQRLRIGRVTFRGAKRCTRCVVVTTDQRHGTIDHPGEPLGTLARLNRRPEGVVFGRNLVPLGVGRLRLGDPVEILA